MSKLLSQTINVYENCDTKQPVVLTQDDFRTTYTRGHDHFVAPILECHKVLTKNKHLTKFQSETKSVTAREFVHKYPENYLPKPDLSYNNQRVQYNKFQTEKIIRLPPRPIDRFVTINSTEFNEKLPKFQNFKACRSEMESIKPSACCAPKYETHPVVFPLESGYQRKLDMYATTNSLAYSGHKIPNRDQITAWNWLGIDTQFGVKLGYWQIPVKIETNQRVTRFTKPRVPNRGGSKSEVTSNFRNPVLTNFKLDNNLNFGD